MIHTISATSVSEAALKTLKELLSDSATVTVSDKGTVRTLGPTYVEIEPCEYKWLTLKGRNNSIIGTLAEIVWVLSGSNVLDGWLDVFLKRAREYSDNGHTWRAGYGPRIYSYGQIDTVLNRIRRQEYTRQAIMSIYDPALDTETSIMRDTGNLEGVTKDMPCNDLLMWDVTDKRLNLTVLNRSNDWAWGAFSINYQEFRVLQDILAGILGLNVGVYRLYSNNMHLYCENPIIESQIKAIVETPHLDVVQHNPSVVKPRVISSPEGFNFQKKWTQRRIQRLFADLIKTIQTESKFVESGDKKINEIATRFLVTHNVSPYADLNHWFILLMVEYMRRMEMTGWDRDQWYIQSDLKTAVMNDKFTTNLRSVIR